MGRAQSLEAATLGALLQSRGLRATSVRLASLAALGDLGHTTPEVLWETLAPRLPGLSLSTIYRTLDVLGVHDLVRHALTAGSVPSYYLSATDDHAHLVCGRCDAVEEATGPVLAAFTAGLLETMGFLPDVGQLTVRGVCRGCLEAGAGLPESAATQAITRSD